MNGTIPFYQILNRLFLDSYLVKIYFPNELVEEESKIVFKVSDKYTFVESRGRRVLSSYCRIPLIEGLGGTTDILTEPEPLQPQTSVTVTE